MEQNKIIFISHDASRTGAPFVLLHLLEWLKKNTDMEFIILLKNPEGELLSEFKKLGKIFSFSEISFSDYTITARIKRRIKKIFNSFRAPVISANEIIEFNPRIIYANTVVSCDVAYEIQNYMTNKPRIICHIHELEIAINKYLGKENFNKVKHKIDYYIAVSNAVQNNLFLNHNISTNKIHLVNAFIPAIQYSKFHTINELKLNLGLKEKDFLITGCGTIDWRKSPDLFIQIAGYVLNKTSATDIYFIWIGGELDSIEFQHLLYDIKKLGFEKQIKILGTVSNPIDYLGISDLFLMTSREDPYPLVCLEAASRSVPILCFSDAGGIPEFVQDDAGCIIPYLNTFLMSEKIIELIKDREQRNRLGKNGQHKVIQNHDVSIAGKKIESILKNIL
jgi:glycosyltransferase involved in cell wall biosynthesis